MRSTIGVFFLVLATNLFSQANNKPFKFPGKLKEMKDMVYVPGGTFTMGRHSEFNPVKKDSNLLCSFVPMRYTLMNFYISNHEVTNNEYRQFITWVQDSIKKKNGDVKVGPENTIYEFKDEDRIEHRANIYPDTTRWATEFPYFYGEPMVTYYYQHPAYADYPVVGISYLQALAYCHWKTTQINRILLPKSMVVIRLPNEAEWEYAAKYRAEAQNNVDYIDNGYLYPWTNFSLQDNKGKYRANFGNIEDVNGLILKNYMDDGATYTALSKSFVTNDLGLYNMAGNVAEWTQGEPVKISFTDTLGRKTEITYQDDLNTVIDKLRSKEYLKKFSKTEMQSWALMYMHDANILHRILSPKMVKGGSWADGVIYIQPGTKEVQSENYTSCRIGFRIAMDVYTFDPKDGL